MNGKKKTLKIRTKIILIYISIVIVSLVLSFGVFGIINERFVEKEVGEVAMQTIGALKGNLGFIFENVTQFSNLIYFDKNVQYSLGNVNTAQIDPRIHQTIKKSLINMLLSGNYMDSVFIFDQYLNSYSSYKTGPILIDNHKVKETRWYQETKAKNGGILFMHGTEQIIQYPTRPDKNCITLVRMINDTDDYKQLAVLLINIDESTILEYFDEVGAKYDSQYCIVDSTGNYVVKPSNYTKNMDILVFNNEIETSGYDIMKREEGKVIVVQQELGIQDWKLIGMMPLDSKSPLGDYQKSLIVLIIALNSIVIFICSVTLMRLVFKPLSSVQEYMEMVEREQFVEIPIEEDKTDEINDLKKGFNAMVRAIQELIEKIKIEEKTIAKNELDIIQAQINPHFLYNTLDAVSALALMEDSKNCFKMTQALGSFYKNSLNAGQELITVWDEIECIKSYITILNVRYNNKIHLECDIEEGIRPLRILKLILQPIVENSVHHGIRNKKGDGSIVIKGYRDEEEIIFIITDDGLGMTEEKVAEILEGRSQKSKSGFGLYSSIQRISLFYGIQKPITITSEIGNGTEITVCIKVMEGAHLYDNQGFDCR